MAPAGALSSTLSTKWRVCKISTYFFLIFPIQPLTVVNYLTVCGISLSLSSTVNVSYPLNICLPHRASFLCSACGLVQGRDSGSNWREEPKGRRQSETMCGCAVVTSPFDTCLLLHLLQSCSCAGKCEYASVSPASNVTLSHQKHHFKKIFSFHSSFSPPKCRTYQTSGDTYDCEPSQLLAQLIWCPSYYQHHLHHRLISKRPQKLVEI